MSEDTDRSAPSKKPRLCPKESKELQLFQRNGETASLLFSADFPGRDIRLIEITPELLDQYEKGNSFKLVGPKDSSFDAVLCTDDKTYTIKKVETSNSLFLIPPSSTQEHSVIGCCRHYYELKSTAPRLQKVVELLRIGEYCGKEKEKEKEDDEGNIKAPTRNFYTEEELRSEIQASRAELDSYLDQLGVVAIEGNIRMVSREYILGE
jgi:sister chromatid cohesion protein DCC1